MHVIDSALDAGIRMFYGRRDSVDVDAIPFFEPNATASHAAWLDLHVRGPWCTPRTASASPPLADLHPAALDLSARTCAAWPLLPLSDAAAAAGR